MKSITCKQLNGKFSASTFDKIAQLNQPHLKEMLQINYQSNIDAMIKMSKLMQNTDSLSQLFDPKKLEFNLLEKGLTFNKKNPTK